MERPCLTADDGENVTKFFRDRKELPDDQKRYEHIAMRGYGWNQNESRPYSLKQFRNTWAWILMKVIGYIGIGAAYSMWRM